MSLWGACRVFGVLLLLLGGCDRSGEQRDAEAYLHAVLAEAAVLAGQGSGALVLVPLRDDEGQRTVETRVLDELLVSGLLRAGVALAPFEDNQEKAWGSADGLPPPYWDKIAAPRVLFGRLRREAGRDFVQLRLVQTKQRQVLGAQNHRLAAGSLQRVAAQRARAQGGRLVAPIEVDLYLIARRDEGGFTRELALTDSARLELGDRFQLRFRVSRDANVYAFMYDSEGQVEEIFAKRRVYSGRMLYGPGEEAWITPGESDRVYTLYFIVAENLDEERDRMFEDMARLIAERRVDRFVGLPLLDRAVAAYVEQRLEGEARARVVRPGPEAQIGEKIIYNDGTALQSRHETLSARPALVRALSFAVY